MTTKTNQPNKTTKENKMIVKRKDGTEAQRIMTPEEIIQFAYQVFSDYYEVQ